MKDQIRNATVERISLDDGDRGLLTAYLYLDYGDAGHQGFGGYSLYLPKDYKYAPITGNFAGHFIYRCMQICEVNSWDKIKGKTLRAVIENGLIVGIGHITKDDWFYPKKDFEKLKL